MKIASASPPPTPPIAAPPGTTPPADRKAAKAAKEFEAVFVGQMTKIMMETATPQGDWSGGHGEEMFRGVLADQLGPAIAARGGIGIAPIVLDQIIRMQGATPDGH